MNILVAPLHYVADRTQGSEYSRAYDYINFISENCDISGDVLVGYMKEKKIGGLNIHSIFKSPPAYISNITRIKFICWLFIKSALLQMTNRYDLIWHNGPFAVGETFSLISIFNFRKLPLIIGPILNPHSFIGEDESRSMGKKSGEVLNIYTRFIKVIDARTYFISKVFSAISYFSLRLSNLVIAKENVVKNLLEAHGISSVITFHTGIYIENRRKSHIGKNSGVIKLINVSYLVERKCTSDLIYMMDYLINIKKRTEFRLEIVGDGPQKELLESLVARLKLSNYVSFTGFVAKNMITMHYGNSDIFVSATLSDTMPAMYFEAMSAGLPMFTYVSATSEELVSIGASIEISPMRDFRSMANAIIKMSGNIETMRKHGDRNSEIYNKYFEFHSQMKKLLMIFYQVSEKKQFNV